jgi:hypothetical protein
MGTPCEVPVPRKVKEKGTRIKLQNPKSKIQNPPCSPDVLGFWILEFLWILEFGIWSFVHRS